MLIAANRKNGKDECPRAAQRQSGAFHTQSSLLDLKDHGGVLLRRSLRWSLDEQLGIEGAAVGDRRYV